MLREETLLMIDEKALAEGKMLVEVMDDLQLESYVDNLLVWIKERESKSFNNEHMDNHNIKMINHYRKELKYIQDHFKKDSLEAFLEKHIPKNEGMMRETEKENIITGIGNAVGEIKNIDLELNEYGELHGLVRAKKGIFNVSITNTIKEEEFFNFVIIIKKL